VRGETELGLSVTVVTFCVSQHLNSSQRYLIQCRSSTLGVAGSPQVVQQFTLAVQTPSAITGYSAPYNEHSSTNTVVRRRTHCWCQHHEDQKKNRPNNKMSAQTLGVRGYWCLMKYASTHIHTHTHTHTPAKGEKKKRGLKIGVQTSPQAVHAANFTASIPRLPPAGSFRCCVSTLTHCPPIQGPLRPMLTRGSRWPPRDSQEGRSTAADVHRGS
jgi:hypothetical protein